MVIRRYACSSFFLCPGSLSRSLFCKEFAPWDLLFPHVSRGASPRLSPGQSIDCSEVVFFPREVMVSLCVDEARQILFHPSLPATETRVLCSIAADTPLAFRSAALDNAWRVVPSYAHAHRVIFSVLTHRVCAWLLLVTFSPLCSYSSFPCEGSGAVFQGGGRAIPGHAHGLVRVGRRVGTHRLPGARRLVVGFKFTQSSGEQQHSMCYAEAFTCRVTFSRKRFPGL